MVVRALAGQIPAAVSELSFTPSEAVKDYLLHDLNGWEMSTFLQHYRSYFGAGHAGCLWLDH